MTAYFEEFRTFIANYLGIRKELVTYDLYSQSVEERRKILSIPESEEESYLQKLYSSQKEVAAITEYFVNQETWFYRESESFVLVAEEYRKKQATKMHPLKILVLACSTGEEPYSLLMSLLEANLKIENVVIDAVDVSQNAINKAKRGLYSSHSFRGKNIEKLQKYFNKVESSYEILPKWKNKVNFYRENITKGYFATEYSYYDLIYCRNLLIYLSPKAQKELFSSIDQLMEEDSLLVLGVSEGENARKYGFIPHEREGKFFYYQKPSVKREQESKKVKKISSISDNTILLKAEELANLGEYRQAIAICQNYLQEGREKEKAYFLLGIIYQAQEEDLIAKQNFQLALDQNPHHKESKISLALLVEKNGLSNE